MADAQLNFCLLSFKVLLGSPPPRCNAVAHIQLLECVQFLLLLQEVEGGEGGGGRGTPPVSSDSQVSGMVQ